MQVKIRNAIITLLWVTCIVGAGPAIGYAQEVSERLSGETTAEDRHVWMMDDSYQVVRDLADRLDLDTD